MSVAIPTGVAITARALGVVALLGIAGCVQAPTTGATAVAPATLPTAVSQPAAATAIIPSLAPMLARVTPAVVNIATEGVAPERPDHPLLDDPFFKRFFEELSRQPRRIQNTGSGVVVDADNGYILTNQHVIDGADTILVTLTNGRRYPARVLGADGATDVAVLTIDAPDLTAVPIADADRLQVGDFVVAIGNPFGLGQTATSGIVSALGRRGLGFEGFEDFIQTDASINPGNSGGALVNLRGELVGINTAILAPSGGSVGINFAIPAELALRLMSDLLTYGYVRRGQLGIAVQDLTPQQARDLGLDGRQGAVVTQVLGGSEARRAGLQTGDVITSVNDRPVANANALRSAIGLLEVGQNARLEVFRNGRLMRLEARVNPSPAAED